jgi:N-acetylglucosamine-6-phosphate deacetylase
MGLSRSVNTATSQSSSSPTYVDLQVNGYVGIDFNDPQTEPEAIHRAAAAMRADGVELALPTIITAGIDAMSQCISNICQAVRADAATAAIFQGVHIEGPFISPQPGFIGAHPMRHAMCQDLAAMERLLAAGGGLVRLVTLAPEMDPQGRMTKMCRERGILIAAGHSDASLDQLDECIAAGLRLFTHLGNGCPRQLDRHDNIIYRALRRADQLRFTLIADGFHVPELLFRNLLDWVPLERLAVVSDAISAAGLGPGTYQLGEREVTIGSDRAARDPSGEHFVGSASTMRDADQWLTKVLCLPDEDRACLLRQNPLDWLSAC